MDNQNRLRVHEELTAIRRIWPAPDITAYPELGKLTVADYQINTTTENGVTHPIETLAGIATIHENGAPRGTMSFIGNRRPKDKDAPARPLVVCFNGGPISAAGGWNAQEIYSPARHEFNEYMRSTQMPDVRSPFDFEREEIQGLLSRWMPGSNTLLRPPEIIDSADIVYADPIGTGYGRMFLGTPDDYFYGVVRDAQSMASFASSYQETFADADQPMFFLASSYGAIRAIEMANVLIDEGRTIGGILFISGAYDYHPIIAHEDERHAALQSILNIPNFASISQDHRQIRLTRASSAATDMGEDPLYENAAEFAWGPYADAILKGRPLKRSEKRRLSKLTRLTLDELAEENFQVSRSAYSRRLLGHASMYLSSVDARFAFPNSTEAEIDPLLDMLKKWRQEGMKQQFADLTARPDEYVFNRGAYGKWSFDGEWQNKSAAVAMKRLLERAPGILISEVNGTADLLNTGETRQLFWDSVLPQVGWKSRPIRRWGDILERDALPQTVAHHNLSVGHQPGIDPYARDEVSRILTRMVIGNDTGALSIINYDRSSLDLDDIGGGWVTHRGPDGSYRSQKFNRLGEYE